MVPSSESEDGTVYHTPMPAPNPTCSAGYSANEEDISQPGIPGKGHASPVSSTERPFVRQDVEMETETESEAQSLFSSLDSPTTPIMTPPNSNEQRQASG